MANGESIKRNTFNKQLEETKALMESSCSTFKQLLALLADRVLTAEEKDLYSDLLSELETENEQGEDEDEQGEDEQ